MQSAFLEKKDCSHHTIFPGVDIFTTHGAHLMLSYVELQPHAVVELHSHPHEQLGYMVEGEMTFTVGEEKKVITAGMMWRIPGGVPHTVTAGDRPCKAIDIFYPIRDDYR